MAIEIATTIDGQISEDDKESWLSVEEFKTGMKISYRWVSEQANEMSLEGNSRLWMMWEIPV